MFTDFFYEIYGKLTTLHTLNANNSSQISKSANTIAEHNNTQVAFMTLADHQPYPILPELIAYHFSTHHIV